MGDPARPDSSILTERELFAQKEILGCKRAFRSESENQKTEQIGNEVHPKQAEFYHGPMSFVFALFPSNWSRFSPFQVTPVIFAEDRGRSICAPGEVHDLGVLMLLELLRLKISRAPG
ncbi:MAG: hypothetical protein ACLQAT_11405 [Candidatus Binataceae bacterium]